MNLRNQQKIPHENRISAPTFYNWKQNYEGIDAQHLKGLKSMQEENISLKRIFADLSMDHLILKDFIENIVWVNLFQLSVL